MSEEKLYRIIEQLQNKIQDLENSRGRDNGLDYTAQVVYSPNDGIVNAIEPKTESTELIKEPANDKSPEHKNISYDDGSNQ